MLRKGDRARLKRRAVSQDDLITFDEGDVVPPLGQELLVLLLPTLVLAALAFAAVAFFGLLTGWWQPSVTLAILCALLAMAAVGSAVYRRRTRLSPAGEKRRHDLAAGVVDEITFGVVAAKAFREPEHGTLSYFLRLDDGRVFFDTLPRLPDAGWEKSPEQIPAADLPGQTLHLLFGAESGELLGARYSGNRINPGGVYLFRSDLSRQPAQMSFDLAWDRIEELFAASPR